MNLLRKILDKVCVNRFEHSLAASEYCPLAVSEYCHNDVDAAVKLAEELVRVTEND